MEVYFVRHGETDGNVARRHQHPETTLNHEGVEQAKRVAWEIAELRPTHIISSTHLRAVQTTQIITSYCENLIPDTHPAFEELKRPDWLVGNRYQSLTTLWYVWLWFLNVAQEGGESYQDLLERVKAARTFLESLPDDARVVVVSHAVFTNIFLEHVCTDKPMSFWRAFRRFIAILKIRNTAILHLRHISTVPGVCGWRFIGGVSKHPKS